MENFRKCVVNSLSEKNFDFERQEHSKHYYGSSAEISKPWDTQKLGFHIESLDPGAFSCPYHLHQEEEELFYVLKESAMVRQDGEYFEINEGDLILFQHEKA